MSKNACTRPPEGWWCSLEEGHDGTCPTHPYYGMPLESVLADYLSPAQIAAVRADLEARITPEMAERQEAARERIRKRNARIIGTEPSEVEFPPMTSAELDQLAEGLGLSTHPSDPSDGGVSDVANGP